MSSSFAFVFPGQGAQSLGMLAELAAVYPLVQDTFAEASAQLGYDLWQLTQEGPEELLNRTDKTQPALLAAEIAIWRIWRSLGGGMPSVVAGHSFGEYTALTVAEALEYAEAVRLVAARGQFMYEAVPLGVGAVAAVLGLDDAEITAVCVQAAEGEVVSPVNFNAPGQVVIAGHASAVERAMSAAKTAGAKKIVKLAVSAPVHCALMTEAANRMAVCLDSAALSVPKIPVIHNVDVTAKSDVAAIRAALVAQIDHPVRWSETVLSMVNSGTITLIECGPGKVLSGLNKRIDRRIKSLPIFDPSSLETTLADVMAVG
ncbi:ACP S-malonyltransferase [Thioflexithrix psekupsensis]|jgi:[acyl-carrier-protein] S-malonyltransferase|uniref:Malonyl CoA-acyl carrier protein transacylase n=1 Tax=Thioflexithrix psekupsensis TaxID=1570016 RepID=A0A251X507_9GAMM|nr:ACP S-malonyltransferase [Thioflexithrix psekupsensis]OUD12476.1 [acyl-carrier-protein] S-malonyltransferase [Thioflexithrix psekupsensis]